MSGDKDTLRARMRALRRGLDPERRAAMSERAAAHVCAAAEYIAADVIAGYVVLGPEIDPAPVLLAALASGKRVALPRVTGPGAMRLHAWSAADPLQRGAMGILQPTPEAPVIAPAEVDLFLLPGLAFDRDGGRLGYGGGYYDRLLPQAPAAFRIGLAYAGQVLGALPVEPHDVRMHAIATENALLRVR